MPEHQEGASPILLLEWWKPVVGFEGYYEVSNVGNVRRVMISRGAGRGGLLRLQLNKKHGYYYVYPTVNRVAATKRVNVLVAEAFLGPCPSGHVVDHINSDKRKNWLSNLEYVTTKENIQRAIQAGRLDQVFARARARSPLTDDDVRAIRSIYPKLGYKLLSRKYGVSASSIKDIVLRKTFRYVE